LRVEEIHLVDSEMEDDSQDDDEVSEDDSDDTETDDEFCEIPFDINSWVNDAIPDIEQVEFVGNPGRRHTWSDTATPFNFLTFSFHSSSGLVLQFTQMQKQCNRPKTRISKDAHGQQLVALK
jgi:hypothetical protein